MSPWARGVLLRVLPAPLALLLALVALRDAADAGMAAALAHCTGALALGASLGPLGWAASLGGLLAAGTLGAWVGGGAPLPDMPTPPDDATVAVAAGLAALGGALSPWARRLAAPTEAILDPGEGLERVAPIGLAAAAASLAAGVEEVVWAWLVWLAATGTAAQALRLHVTGRDARRPALLLPTRVPSAGRALAPEAALLVLAAATEGPDALPFAMLLIVARRAAAAHASRLLHAVLADHEDSPFRGGPDEPAALHALILLVPSVGIAVWMPRAADALGRLAAPAWLALLVGGGLVLQAVLAARSAGRIGPAWRRVAAAAPACLFVAAGLGARRGPNGLGEVVVELAAYTAAATVAAVAAWSVGRSGRAG